MKVKRKLRVYAIVVYAVAGPAVGMFLLLLAAFMREALTARYSGIGLVDLIVQLPGGLLLSYVFGEVPAVATGFLVAAKLSWSRYRLRFVLGSAALGFAVTWAIWALLAVSGRMLSDALIAGWFPALIGGGAALVCSSLLLLTKRGQLASAFQQ